MSSPSKRREMDLMKLMMIDCRVEMISDGIHEFYVDFHDPNDRDSSQGLDIDVNIPSSTWEAEDRTARATPGTPNNDEEENPNSSKKLRLSKEQFAFLEESFKEHTTLNLKQKVALAKQLNLTPRQEEV